jgi:hypothetical protein
MDSALPEFRLPPTSRQNGRIDLTSTSSAGGFLADSNQGGFAYRTQIEEGADESLLRGNWTGTKLSKMFFSPANVKAIQNTIRKGVYDKSGDKKWLIDDQNIEELQIIMRSLFLQYAKNLECDIPGQIKDLNALVVDWCVPRILSEVSMYYYYLQDVSKLPVPLSHPVVMSPAGTKSLPFRNFM